MYNDNVIIGFYKRCWFLICYYTPRCYMNAGNNTFEQQQSTHLLTSFVLMEVLIVDPCKVFLKCGFLYISIPVYHPHSRIRVSATWFLISIKSILLLWNHMLCHLLIARHIDTVQQNHWWIMNYNNTDIRQNLQYCDCCKFSWIGINIRDLLNLNWMFTTL